MPESLEFPIQIKGTVNNENQEINKNPRQRTYQKSTKIFNWRERERDYPMKEMMVKVREEELGCGAADDQVGEESKKMEEKIRLRDHSV
jgi:hypothetical protein